MCGIVGYVGGRTAAPILLNGLRRPEYRGYDSAGVATIHEGTVSDLKTVGKVAILAESLDAKPLEGTIGIPHTRWATHGRPSERNAHPYFDASHRIAVVHNGIIENHVAIRQFLEGQGIAFQSETDSESIAQLIGFFFDQTGDFLASVRQAVRDVRGTFGLAVLCSEVPHTLVAVRRGSPLLVGVGEGEYIVASDGGAIVEHTNRVVYPDDAWRSRRPEPRAGSHPSYSVDGMWDRLVRRADRGVSVRRACTRAGGSGVRERAARSASRVKRRIRWLRFAR